MADSPDAKRGLLSGLLRVLHLHQLPQATPPEKRPVSGYPSPRPDEILPVSSTMAAPPRATIASASSAPQPPRVPQSIVSPAPMRAAPAAPVPVRSIPGSTAPKAWPASTRNAQHVFAKGGKGLIVTDYDRILDLVRMHATIKLDEIARLLSLKEELVAQELQTLEDNGLVEVKYPAFGEPLIYFKEPEA